MMPRISSLLAAAGLAFVTACSSDDGPPPPPEGAPAAPSDLTVGLSGLSAILNWVDNSDAETRFVIKRNGGGSDWATRGSVPAGVTTYTDTGGQWATTYEYSVVADNERGSSARSNTASVTTPAYPPTGGGGGCLLVYESGASSEVESVRRDTVWLCAEDAVGTRITAALAVGGNAEPERLSAGAFGSVVARVERSDREGGFHLALRMAAQPDTGIGSGLGGEICFAFHLDAARSFVDFFEAGGVSGLHRQRLSLPFVGSPPLAASVPFAGTMPIVSGRPYVVEFEVDLDAGVVDAFVDGWCVATDAPLETLFWVPATYVR